MLKFDISQSSWKLDVMNKKNSNQVSDSMFKKFEMESW